MGRMDKVEQGFSALEQKWESNNSGILNELSSVHSSIDRESSRVKKIEEDLAKYKEKWESLETLEKKIKIATNESFKELKDSITVEVRTEVAQEAKAAQSASEREIRYEMLKGKAFNKRHNIVVFGIAETSSQEEDLKAVSTFFSARMGFPKLNIEVVYRLGTAGGRWQAPTPRREI